MTRSGFRSILCARLNTNLPGKLSIRGPYQFWHDPQVLCHCRRQGSELAQI